MTKKSTTTRLAWEVRALRDALAMHLGASKGSIIPMALRKMARAEGVPIPEPPASPPKPHPKKKRPASR
jgi:hypothetical protein